MERMDSPDALRATSGLAILPAAFLFGALAAVSSCCTLPVLGAVAGYASSLDARSARRERLYVALAFMVGTILSLAALGAVTGFVGDLAGASLDATGDSRRAWSRSPSAS